MIQYRYVTPEDLPHDLILPASLGHARPDRCIGLLVVQSDINKCAGQV